MKDKLHMTNPAPYLSDLNQEHLFLEKLGRPDKNTWSVQGQEGSFVLKTSQKKRHFRPSYWLSLYYLQKEISIYRQLEQISLKQLWVPRLVKYRPRQFLLVEKIDHGRKGWHRDQISQKQLVQALLEFHHLPLKTRQSGLVSCLLEAKNSLTSKLMIWSFTRVLPSCGLKAFFKTLQVIMICQKKQKRFKQPLLLHHDLMRRNNMLSADEGLYLIDFESVRHERRWILHDIIDVALYQKQFKLNKKLLRTYVQKLVQDNPVFQQVHVSAQIRMVMLHRFMARILPEGKHEEDLRRKWFDFYHHVLLSQAAFDQWYRQTVDL